MGIRTTFSPGASALQRLRPFYSLGTACLAISLSLPAVASHLLDVRATYMLFAYMEGIRRGASYRSLDRGFLRPALGDIGVRAP